MKNRTNRNRLAKMMQAARKNRSKVFCAFLTLGYPNLQVTERLILEFEELGVDIVELGFPFSDPLADGPTIQYSSERALEKGIRMHDAFRLAAKLRRKGCKVPIVFFGYLNPIYHYGLKPFVRDAAAAGFDGLIIPDLPPEEETDFNRECRRQGLAQIFLVAPTTEKKRAAAIARHSKGFIYYVSLRGVTGARKTVPQDLRSSLNGQAWTGGKPVLVGFGISKPDQAKQISQIFQGVVVGSAVIDQLRKAKGKTGPVLHYMRQMVQAVKGGMKKPASEYRNTRVSEDQKIR